jgi:hypothetical protein
MATKLGLYKAACVLLKQTPITTLTDDFFPRYRLDDCYSDVVLWCLSEGAWNFGTRTMAIDASVDLASQFGFTSVFAKPDDWVRTTAIASVDTMWPPLGPGQFADETTNWHADCNPLYVSFVSSDTAYGLDLSLWLPTFTRAVEYELAFRIAPVVAGISEAEFDALDKRRQRAMKDARSKDALNQASQRPPPGRLLQSRLGGAARTWVSSVR